MMAVGGYPLTRFPNSQHAPPSLSHSRAVLWEDSRVVFPIPMERKSTTRRGHFQASLTKDIGGSLRSLELSILLRNTFQCSQRNQTKNPQGSNTSEHLGVSSHCQNGVPNPWHIRISETCTQMAPWELLGSCNKGRLCKDLLWFASGLGSGGPSC